jgi:hypothetical protein
MLRTQKEYISLQVYWDTQRNLTPKLLYLEGGGRYEVDRVLEICPRCSKISGGYGLRHLLRASDDEEGGIGLHFYAFFERTSVVGRWRCENDYVDMLCRWEADGAIRPLAMYPPGTAAPYIIDRVAQCYPMSTTKADGSGMRYVVLVSCKEDGIRQKRYDLMLEDGGRIVGRWFYERAEVSGQRI